MIKTKVQKLKSSETIISADVQKMYERHLKGGNLPVAFELDQLKKIKQDLGYES